MTIKPVIFPVGLSPASRTSPSTGNGGWKEEEQKGEERGFEWRERRV